MRIQHKKQKTLFFFRARWLVPARARPDPPPYSPKCPPQIIVQLGSTHIFPVTGMYLLGTLAEVEIQLGSLSRYVRCTHKVRACGEFSCDVSFLRARISINNIGEVPSTGASSSIDFKNSSVEINCLCEIG